MNFRRCATISVVALLAACGNSDTTFTMSSGVYAVSSGTPGGVDDCNMVQYFFDPTPTTDPNDDPFPIRVAVSGARATIDLAYDPTDPAYVPAAGSLVTVDVAGNGISNAIAGAYDKAVDLRPCQYRQTMTVNGEITADDQVALTAVYTKTVNATFTCTRGDLLLSGTATDPFTTCTSTVHFLGARTGP